MVECYHIHVFIYELVLYSGFSNLISLFLLWEKSLAVNHNWNALLATKHCAARASSRTRDCPQCCCHAPEIMADADRSK